MVNRRGIGSTGCLVYLLVLAGVAYFGTPFATTYFNYYRLKDAMEQEAGFAAQRTDVVIQGRLRLFADSLGMPDAASRVKVRRSPLRVTISSSYVESIPVPIIGTRKIHFNPQAEASF